MLSTPPHLILRFLFLSPCAPATRNVVSPDPWYRPKIGQPIAKQNASLILIVFSHACRREAAQRLVRSLPFVCRKLHLWKHFAGYYV